MSTIGNNVTGGAQIPDSSTVATELINGTIGDIVTHVITEAMARLVTKDDIDHNILQLMERKEAMGGANVATSELG